MAVYDCFTFFNELDLLEIRLNVLAEVVDRFVIVEADRTFQGSAKPLHFAANRERFAPFLDRIVHVPISLEPGRSGWELEHAQRNAILFGLEDCRPDDVVLIGDVDEVPQPSLMPTILARAAAAPVALKLKNYYYYLNMCSEQQWYGSLAMALRWRTWLSGEIVGTVALSWQELLVRNGPQSVRDARPALSCLDAAGWHWSFLGGAEAIRVKVGAFAHAEHNTAALEAAQLEKAMRQGRDPFGRWYLGFRFRPVPLDERFPEYVRRNAGKFPHLFFE